MAGMGNHPRHKLTTFCKERSEPKTGFPLDPIVFELMDQLSMGDLVECLSKVEHNSVNLAMVI